MNLEKSWKKVHLGDLGGLSYELVNAIEGPAVILLSGPVGSGKTTLMKEVLKQLVGERSSSMSPSYSVINDFENVVHADFYRIEDREEIIHLELPLYLERCEFMFIEWGKMFWGDLQNMIEDHFQCFELEIIHPSEMDNERDYFLRSLDLFT